LKELYYSIADEVFSKFPGYVRGVVIAHQVHNGDSPPELVAMLREAEGSLRQKTSLEQIAAHPNIAAWREAFRQMGVKPSEFRSSIEALGRRALREQQLPSINALVDIGNILSLRHLAPAGGHAIDVLTGDITLRPATGQEIFVPFGEAPDAAPEHPNPGEIVFVEGNTVLTRRWVWRQSNHTLTLPTSSAYELNIDGLPPVTSAEVEQICQEGVELIQRFCGGRLRYELISQQNPRIRLTV
jgi:DNA/RNA-binding domain of Phe-tRNA-synthetase-like protein